MGKEQPLLVDYSIFRHNLENEAMADSRESKITECLAVLHMGWLLSLIVI